MPFQSELLNLLGVGVVALTQNRRNSCRLEGSGQYEFV